MTKKISTERLDSFGDLVKVPLQLFFNLPSLSICVTTQRKEKVSNCILFVQMLLGIKHKGFLLSKFKIEVSPVF
jgi:hypothetical protein